MIFKFGNQPASKICPLSKKNKTRHRIRILNVLCSFVQNLVAELFGESDSEDEAPLPPTERQAPSNKSRLEELAQRKRKEAVRLSPKI